MLSASAGIGSRKNICHKTQTAGQAFTACPAALSARILKVFSLSMAVQPLSYCLRFSHRHRIMIRLGSHLS